MQHLTPNSDADLTLEMDSEQDLIAKLDDTWTRRAARSKFGKHLTDRRGRRCLICIRHFVVLPAACDVRPDSFACYLLAS